MSESVGNETQVILNHLSGEVAILSRTGSRRVVGIHDLAQVFRVPEAPKPEFTLQGIPAKGVLEGVRIAPDRGVLVQWWEPGRFRSLRVSCSWASVNEAAKQFGGAVRGVEDDALVLRVKIPAIRWLLKKEWGANGNWLMDGAMVGTAISSGALGHLKCGNVNSQTARICWGSTLLTEVAKAASAADIEDLFWASRFNLDYQDGDVGTSDHFSWAEAAVRANGKSVVLPLGPRVVARGIISGDPVGENA